MASRSPFCAAAIIKRSSGSAPFATRSFRTGVDPNVVTATLSGVAPRFPTTFTSAPASNRRLGLGQIGRGVHESRRIERVPCVDPGPVLNQELHQANVGLDHGVHEGCGVVLVCRIDLGTRLKQSPDPRVVAVPDRGQEVARFGRQQHRPADDRERDAYE